MWIQKKFGRIAEKSKSSYCIIIAQQGIMFIKNSISSTFANSLTY